MRSGTLVIVVPNQFVSNQPVLYVDLMNQCSMLISGLSRWKLIYVALASVDEMNVHCIRFYYMILHAFSLRYLRSFAD